MNRQSTNITYKVWAEIEQYDEATETGLTLDAPGASLAQFGTYEEAYAFAESLQRDALTTRQVRQQNADHHGEVKLRLAIERVPDYLYFDEFQDYTACNNPAVQSCHIFRSLITLRNWLNNNP
jgi:hypothetical protein